MPSFQDELEAVEQELGVSGYETVGAYDDDDAEIGARRRKAKKQAVQNMRRIRVPKSGGIGTETIGLIPCAAQAALPAATAGSLTFTPFKDCEILDLFIDVAVAAAAAAAIMPAAVAITSIVVQGEPVLAGTGDLPCTIFNPRGNNRQFGEPFIRWPNLDASQTCTVNLINRDAATAQNVSGALLVRFTK